MKTQNKSFGDTLQSIREYYENKKKEDKYNDAGFLKKPDSLPMRDGGWPQHNPSDLPESRSNDDWYDYPKD